MKEEQSNVLHDLIRKPKTWNHFMQCSRELHRGERGFRAFLIERSNLSISSMYTQKWELVHVVNQELLREPERDTDEQTAGNILTKWISHIFT